MAGLDLGGLTAGFIEDPDRERILLEAIEARRVRHTQLRRSISLEDAKRADAIGTMYPSLGNDLVTALVLTGVDPNHQAIFDLAQRKAEQDQTGFNRIKDRAWAGFKGLVRGAFVGAEAAWEETIGRGTRTAVGIAQGRSPLDALNQAGGSSLQLALSERSKGNRVNFGEGFIPRSEIATETPEYEALVQAGVPRSQAAGALQASLGQPVTQLARSRAEAGTQFLGQPVSLGRVAAGSLGEILPGKVLEPGTREYNLMSGLIDAYAQIKVDPSAAVGGRFAKLRRANQTLGQRSVPALLTGRPRKTIHSQSAGDWLNSTNGRELVDWISKNDSIVALRNVLKVRDRRLLGSLIDETDPEAINDILRNSLSLQTAKKPVPSPSILRTAIPGADTTRSLGRDAGKLIAGDVGEIGGFKTAVAYKLEDGFFGRMLGQMPGKILDVDDLDNGLEQFDDFLKFARFSVEEREPLLRALATIDDGDVAAASRVVYDAMDLLAPKLVEKGVKPIVADKVVDLYKSQEDFRKYFLNELGRPETFPGSRTTVMTRAGVEITQPTAQLLTEYLDRAIPLPDARQLRQMTGALRGLRRGDIGNEKLWSLGSVENLADAYMQKFWKPAVLLRLAWPVRVISEEQIRMSAAGLSAAFRHPVSYLGWVIGNSDSKSLSKLDEILGDLVPAKGQTGVFTKGSEAPLVMGESRAFLDTVYDDIALSRTHQKVMSRRQGGWLGESDVGRAGITRDWVSVRKGETRFLDAWVRNLAQLAADPVAIRVARQGGEDTKEWFWSGEGAKFRKELATRSGKEKAPLLNDRSFADTYIEGIEARIHLTAGGRYSRVSKTTKEPLDGDKAIWAAGNDAGFKIEDPGVDEILEALASGEYRGLSIRQINNRKELASLKEGLEEHIDRAPDVLKGVRLDDGDNFLALDGAVDRLFSALMSTPTNNLSRSPAFRQFYWKRIGQLRGAMDSTTRAKVDTLRRRANISEKELEDLAEGVAIDGGAELLNDLEVIDDLAKAYALDETKKLLYDLNKRSNASDILRNIFPFGEAWAEIITTWSRLLTENPHQLRRAQQGIQGARAEGFFYENENGEELYAVPGGGILRDWMFGGVDETPVDLQLAGRVRSLNMITATIMPGFGPIVQVAASHMIPETPKYEELRDVLLPFGPTKIEGPGDLIEIAAPTWLRNFLTSADSNDPEINRIYNGTVIQVYKALLLSGEGSDAGPGVASETMEKAKKIARRLGTIRAVISFGAPSPISVEYNARDTEGRQWEFLTLARAYQDHVNLPIESGGSGGDDIETFQWFTDTFGLDPSVFATRNTRTLVARAVTKDAADWERENPELFEQFPLSAFFANPGAPGDEFDIQAYMRQFRQTTVSGEAIREGVTPEQFEAERNKLLGSIAYRNQVRRIGGRQDDAARAWLRAVHDQLKEIFPGYDTDTIGLGARPERDSIIAEMQNWSPELLETPAGQGIAKYLQARQAVIDQYVASGGAPEGWKTANSMQAARQWLQSVAAQLQRQHPAFTTAWHRVFESELRADESPEFVNLTLPSLP